MRNIAIIMIACCTLSACGVKPGSVEPPEGSDNSQYQRTYPDVRTDPAPHGGTPHIFR